MFLADAAVFRMRGLGWIMKGHIPVARGTAAVTRAFHHAAAELAGGAAVLVYPEGRIGLDPGLWPERGKTGAARLAQASGAPVVPVAQWGAHELVPYAAPRGAPRALARSLRRRPVVRVHFGPPVPVTGTPRQATDAITAALAAALAPLRPDEPDLPRHVDPTRPPPMGPPR
ncbi:hypothetical protein Prum_094140 [Phytohabitans rumicis]|uniref:Phospholipid/glycerol acyltransferase domain-containing protein n=1 Tax=Phytohabitans rumicis TaxID=1076125 RepID=A0A6V8LEW2_9ACTN|nr:hypothetical protein Prum_094140 [Phytohabitans rumicis]